MNLFTLVSKFIPLEHRNETCQVSAGVGIMKKLLIISVLAAVLALLGSGVALAATGGTIPHGGYSPATDACLQCHDIHESAGDYVLMRWPTVTDTCGTCHTLFQVKPASGESGTPGYLGDIRGSVSGRILDDPTPRALGSFEPFAFSLAPLQDTDGDTLGDLPYKVGENVNYYPGKDWRGVGPDGFSGAEASIPWWDTDNDGDLDMPEYNSTPGTGSPYEAYQLKADNSDNRGGKLGHRGHRLGNLGERGGLGVVKDNIIGGKQGYSAIKQWEWPLVVPSTTYAATSGLYCASCHTPHGTWGRMLPTMVSTRNPQRKQVKSPSAPARVDWCRRTSHTDQAP